MQTALEELSLVNGQVMFLQMLQLQEEDLEILHLEAKDLRN